MGKGLPLAQETWVQSQVESYQRLKKWYLMPPWLTLSIIKYRSRVNLSNPVKGVVHSLHLGIVANEKGAFRSHLTMVTSFTLYINILNKHYIINRNKRCPWCNGYRRRKWTWRHESNSWTRLIAFHIALIPLGKVWIQLFSLQLWVNSRTD